VGLLLLAFSAMGPTGPALAHRSQGLGQELDRAINAALADQPAAVLVQALTTPCQSVNSDPNGSCLFVTSTEQNAQRGIAKFSISAVQGGGASEIYGKGPDGAWKYWFGTQQPIYQLLDLPGPMLVCAGGDGINIRSAASPDAQVLGQAGDGARLTAENFVLTEPGSFNSSGLPTAGRGGWYQISAPQQGWVYSRFVTDAGLGSCMWHDLLTSGG
jgi:hypothetical protein